MHSISGVTLIYSSIITTTTTTELIFCLKGECKLVQPINIFQCCVLYFIWLPKIIWCSVTPCHTPLTHVKIFFFTLTRCWWVLEKWTLDSLISITNLCLDSYSMTINNRHFTSPKTFLAYHGEMDNPTFSYHKERSFLIYLLKYLWTEFEWIQFGFLDMFVYRYQLCFQIVPLDVELHLENLRFLHCFHFARSQKLSAEERK